MDTVALIIVIIAVVVVAMLFVGAFIWQRRRSQSLRDDFGSEYERTLRQRRSRNTAERELEDRRKRVRSLDIRPLRPEQADRYREAWLGVQARFVDDPQNSLNDADRLISDVMHARGYPEEDYEHRVDDISVEHPETVGRYRKAHGIQRARSAGRPPQLDQLRDALLDYRRVFMEMLDDTPARRQAG